MALDFGIYLIVCRKQLVELSGTRLPLHGRDTKLVWVEGYFKGTTLAVVVPRPASNAFPYI